MSLLIQFWGSGGSRNPRKIQDQSGMDFAAVRPDALIISSVQTNMIMILRIVYSDLGFF